MARHRLYAMRHLHLAKYSRTWAVAGTKRQAMVLACGNENILDSFIDLGLEVRTSL